MLDCRSDFCHNIYILRKYHRLTQKEMALRLGIGVGSLRKLEGGVLPPRMTVEVLGRIFTEFGIKPSEITGGDFHPERRKAPSD